MVVFVFLVIVCFVLVFCCSEVINVVWIWMYVVFLVVLNIEVGVGVGGRWLLSVCDNVIVWV